MYSYVFKRIIRSWSLFIAFFLGLTLAVSLFTGTLIGADAIGAETVKVALQNIPVDIVAVKNIKNFTSSNIEASLTSIQPIQGITHNEAMYRINARVFNVNKNFTLTFTIIVLSRTSALLQDAVFSNSLNTLGLNQMVLEEGSTDTGRYSMGDTLTLRIQVQNQTKNPKPLTYFFSSNLTLSNTVRLSDSAFSVVWSTSEGNAWTLLQQLILGTQLRRPSYNLIIMDDPTLYTLLTAIYSQNSLPFDNVRLSLLTWLDRKTVIKPWDIEQSVLDAQTIQALMNNALLSFGFGTISSSTINLLTRTLNGIQTLTNTLKLGFVVLALPVIFTAWYMGRTVSDVSLNLRRREIGLLQTKGFSKNQVLRLFLSETLLLGLIASASGIVIGVAILPIANLETNILDCFHLLDLYTIALVMVFGVVLAFVSVFSPARKAANMKTVDAIRDYSPEESEAKLKLRWPLVTFILGFYKILALTIGFDPRVLRPPSFNLFINILFSVAVFIDQILGYIAPVLFFWGFSKIFIQGSFWLQAVIGKLSNRFAGGLGEIATQNAKLNTKRTAAVAFLLALIVGYGVSVIGGLASTDDFRQRSIYASVGADIS
ncbi:FtsX-like permease family protein, partial [Candidatus Bathyarchaeota archaeon]|nr:FtsX-like permease family protein [Candidatus Bathyarchaeota archaeon]